jgi:hypothetical protein
MSENLDDVKDMNQLLIERYRKAVSDQNETYVKQKLLILKLWEKIAELIADPKELAEFISDVYE